MKKKLLTIMTTLALALPSLADWWTDPSTGIAWYYFVSSGKAIIKDVSSDISGAITIPSTFGGCPVTSIGDGAFDNCRSLTSVTIPKGVTTIGYEAFYGCSSLASVTIPKGVTTIGYEAFSGCRSLTSVTIPKGVTSIGNRMFLGCSSLANVSIPSSVISIGNQAFLNCSSLTSVTIPPSVTTIGDSAFSGCRSLTSVTIPSSVKIIGDSALMVKGEKKKLTVYVSAGDEERVKKMLKDSHFDVNGVIFKVK